jgi:hypothetical protein
MYFSERLAWLRRVCLPSYHTGTLLSLPERRDRSSCPFSHSRVRCGKLRNCEARRSRMVRSYVRWSKLRNRLSRRGGLASFVLARELHLGHALHLQNR